MSDNHIPGYCTLGSAVIGIIPMITHHKVFAFRHGIRTEGVQPAISVFIINIWLFVPFSIDIQISITNFNGISRQTYDSFDKIGITPAWVTADHNIKALGIPSCGNPGSFFLGFSVLPRKTKPG